MPTTAPIPDGSATFRDKLKVRQRNLIEDAQAALVTLVGKLPPEVVRLLTGEVETLPEGTTIQLSAEDGREMQRLQREVQEARLVAYLESWTYDRPLPTTETLGDEDEDVYDALMAALDALEAARQPTSVDLSETPIGTPAQPVESPTPGSESSATLSTDGSEPVGASTPSSSSASAPTSTAVPSPV